MLEIFYYSNLNGGSDRVAERPWEKISWAVQLRAASMYIGALCYGGTKNGVESDGTTKKLWLVFVNGFAEFFRVLMSSEW